MPKKNKIQQNVIFCLFLFFLLIILLIKIDFFKHLYFLSKNNYTERMINTYGYCDKESYGFLNDLIKKQQFTKNPKILNSNVVPNSDWMIYNSKLDFEEQPNIFLNYQKNPTLVFKYFNNNFMSQGHVQYTDFLNSITFKTNNKNFNLNNNIIIFVIKNGEKKIIFEKFINKKIINEETINISFQTKKLNSRWDQLYIEIENFKNDQSNIHSITLNLTNEYLFGEDDIIYSKDNCFYIK
jgi:hypothetical protein